MANICVLTLYTPNIASYAKITCQNKVAYCAKHGYTFIAETNIDKSRHPSWSKIILIKKYLPHFDWIFWTDADSLIINFAKRIEQYITPKYDLILNKEAPNCGYGEINCGHLIFRNSKWSLNFLNKIYNQTEFIDDIWYEQASIIELVYSGNYNNHIKIIPQRCINSYVFNYKKGDFIIHFPGIDNDDKAFLIKEWINYVINVNPIKVSYGPGQRKIY